MGDYDSRPDTMRHKDRVFYLLVGAVTKILKRANNHDKSKLESPEKEVFDEMTPKLKNSTYGSDEYKEFLKSMGKGLEHHYRENRHHPEHFNHGTRGMGLIDLLEMLCDWRAASERHDDGDMGKSMKINGDRFDLSDEMMQILWNTIGQLGWLDTPPTSTFRRGIHDYAQDVCEGCVYASVGGTDNPAKMKAPKYIKPEEAEEYLAGYLKAAKL